MAVGWRSILNSDLVGGVVQGAAAKGPSMRVFSNQMFPKVGYQGKIPELQAVRERVPMQQPAEGEAPVDPEVPDVDTFSDTQFAGRPNPSAPSVAQAQSTAQAQAQQLAEQKNQARGMASGGIASAYNRRHNGYYLGGKTDGMADKVPANIDGNQEARLSDGEFVIPADVVSHLGNGNSDAGADQLHGMMEQCTYGTYR